MKGKHMKVAIGSVFDEYGGASRHMLKIKKFSSHKISIIPSDRVRKILALQKRINMRIFGREMGYRVPYHKMLEIKKIRNFDIVHSEVDPWFTKLALSSRSDNCKWVHTYHTLYFKEDWGQLQRWQERINDALITVAPSADVKISGSQWMHDYLYETYGIDTVVIPNGVDIEECSMANPERFCNEHDQKDFVLFVGSISPIKNPKCFVDLAMSIPNTPFVMIGRSLTPFAIMKKYNVSIPRNLTIMPEMTHDELLDALSVCKVFVMTSRSEGLPATLLEAMALGKSVVVPSHTGCKEVVHSEKYGYLYTPDSIESLAERVSMALNDSIKGKNAMKRVEENYSWKKLIKRIDRIYEGVRYNESL